MPTPTAESTTVAAPMLEQQGSKATLTPKENPAPAVATIPEKELSGANWCSRFAGSTSTAELESSFKACVDLFISALREAGATITISATYRPPERAYLMHWSWKIANGSANATDAPPMTGVNIEWNHGTAEASKAAANAMVTSYGMSGLKVAPALRSRHTERKAIDMTISWKKELVITGADGKQVTINTEPRSGMNEDVHSVGNGYGVIKFWKGEADKPHWSTDGR